MDAGRWKDLGCRTLGDGRVESGVRSGRRVVVRDGAG